MWSMDSLSGLFRRRLFMCFFFSSRRRHTRFDCDWSSDVCSSDLKTRAAHPEGVERRFLRPYAMSKGVETWTPLFTMQTDSIRSEEGRVGEEGRSRGWPYH